MAERMSFTLDAEASAFLAERAGRNKSAYLNQLLLDEKQRLEEAIVRANREEAEDPAYLDELAAWDETLPDGLES